ncbi:MAG: hypothetical protein ACJAYU_001462 [Bradymonadia bacterium]|jgi:hypothetical protein
MCENAREGSSGDSTEMRRLQPSSDGNDFVIEGPSNFVLGLAVEW